MTETEDQQVLAVDQHVLGARSALAFAFLGSGCLLVLELVAARLIAPTLGVSLYTWTSVIGVVLGGVAAGNYLGGRIADRWPSRAALAWAYLAGAATTLLVLLLVPHIESFDLPRGAPAIAQVLWIVAVLFLLPSLALGIPTPILVRLVLTSVEQSGRVVGRVQAAATVGSICGTFLTGFALVSLFGTHRIVAGVAGLLLALAVAAYRRLPQLPWVAGVLLIGVGVGLVRPGGNCTTESNYYCIRVSPGLVTKMVDGQEVQERPAIQDLYLDALVHAQVNTAEPTDLIYDYELLYQGVFRALYRDGDSFDTFLIGGGGYAFPRYIQEVYLGGITVAEIDPAVTRTARDDLDLYAGPRMQILTEDARVALRDLPAETQYDMIIGDAFNDYGVPAHLATREFDRLVADRLRPGGTYLLNLVDGEKLAFLRSTIRTLRAEFGFVGLISGISSWPPNGDRDTFVLLASDERPNAPLLPLVDPAAVDEFMQHGDSVLLTDDYAPVEQLLAPVFSAALHDGR